LCNRGDLLAQQGQGGLPNKSACKTGKTSEGEIDSPADSKTNFEVVTGEHP